MASGRAELRALVRELPAEAVEPVAAYVRRRLGPRRGRYGGYSVVIEGHPGAYGAWVRELPGCVAAAPTRAEVEREIKRAIPWHVEGLQRRRLPVPPPRAPR